MNSPDHISESLETIFWVRILQSLIRIQDGKKRIRDKYPGSATLAPGRQTPESWKVCAGGHCCRSSSLLMRSRIRICIKMNKSDPNLIKVMWIRSTAYRSATLQEDPEYWERMDKFLFKLRQSHLKYKCCRSCLVPVFRIRIHFFRIRIQRLRLETTTDPDTDPDPIRIQGFNDQKLKKNDS